MEAMNRWRLARFDNEDRRSEFIEHAKAIELDGIEVEPQADLRVRFRAPAQYEIGLAGMVTAHGGIVLPSPDAALPLRRARTA